MFGGDSYGLPEVDDSLAPIQFIFISVSSSIPFIVISTSAQLLRSPSLVLHGFMDKDTNE